MEPKQAIEQVPDKRFALLIDADNVSAKYIKPIMAELSKYGTITYKRIYGDWTLSLHAKWKDALLENSITPIQQFSYTYGKNSTDSAMIIDAMDILYTGQVEGFCIVSSDSDFTRLASRLRESGRTVIGMGEKKTPAPFRKACDIFTVLELLVKAERSEKAGGPVMSKAEVEQAVVDIVVDNQNNGKATGLGEIGSRLQKRYPDFDVRNYGTNLLSKLLGEFTRVKITKDHSSVAVELVDNGEPEKPAEPKDAKEAKDSKDTKEAEAKQEASKEDVANSEGKGRGEGKNGKPKQDEPKTESAEAVKEEPKRAEDEPEKDNRPGRRNRRSRRLRLGDAEPQEAAKPEPQAEDGAPAQAESDVLAEAKETGGAEKPHEAKPADEQPAKSAPEPAKAAKPARKPRRRRKAAPVEEASAAEAAPAPEPAPAETPTAASEAATAPEPRSPQLLIRELIAQAGEEGIALTKLGEDIRAEFKNFKVRDLGFAQLRLYIASIEDYQVVKSNKAFFAKMRKQDRQGE